MSQLGPLVSPCVSLPEDAIQLRPGYYSIGSHPSSDCLFHRDFHAAPMAIDVPNAQSPVQVMGVEQGIVPSIELDGNNPVLLA